MCVFNFDDGMVAESWYAELALRSRVSMSAIGSVIVMACGASLAAVPHTLGLSGLGVSRTWRWASRRSVVRRLGTGAAPLQGRRRPRPGSHPELAKGGEDGVLYQLDLLTPGSSPAWAISRRQIRHRPNLRKTACGRPHRWQRVYPRTAHLGVRAALLTRAFLAISRVSLTFYADRVSGSRSRRSGRRRGTRAA